MGAVTGALDGSPQHRSALDRAVPLLGRSDGDGGGDRFRCRQQATCHVDGIAMLQGKLVGGGGGFSPIPFVS